MEQSTTDLAPAAFIVGVPRSGTTLLRMMLDSHPEMAVPPESHFFFEMLKLVGPESPTREEFYSFLITFFSWEDFGISRENLGMALAALEPFTLTKGLRTFYELYAGRFGKSRWGEKTPDYGTIMPQIAALLPEAHFVHIIRDGRDVALSRRHLWFGPGQDMRAQAEDWASWIVRARAEGPSCPHYMEIRYEDLVASPAEVLREVCDFIQLPFSEAMLSYHETSGARLTALQGWPQLQLSGEQLQSVLRTTTKPPQIDRVARWQREMASEETSLFEEVAGPLLQEFGYEVRSVPTTVASPYLPAGGARTAPSVSALLFTDGISATALPWFLRLREQVDEFVVWVDSPKANADTEERVRQFATRIEHFASRGLTEPFLHEGVRSCRTDWVFRIDSDEELSPAWDDGRWRDLLGLGPSSFALPRRWLTPSGGYLRSAPWWPDYQIRLFRNLPEKIRFFPHPHSVMEMEGRRGYLQSLALHHHDLRLSSRTAREAKVRFYQTKDAPDLGYFYLYEEHEPPEAALPAPGALDLDSEILHLGILFAREASELSLEILTVPEAVATSAFFWPRVRLTNGTRRALCSVPPFPVYLSYHWAEASSGQVILANGQRTPLLPSLAPGATVEYPLFVSAPSAPGDYLLQVSLVQENIRWFESANPEILREARVRVTAGPVPKA